LSSITAAWLYFTFAVGGVGLYLLLPRRRPVSKAAGVILGLLGLAAWLLVIGLGFVTSESTGASFYLFSAIAILAAARVITHTKPVYSAVYFVLVVVAVAALLVLLDAEFLAIALIIIYAGAILVTYLFVIMLAQQSGAPAYDRAAREPFWSVAAGFVVMAAIAGRAGQPATVPQAQAIPVADVATTLVLEGPVCASAPPKEPEGNTALVGSALMTRYIVGVELSGVLLLISMIGAIALARKRVTSETASPARVIGQAGREVPPF